MMTRKQLIEECMRLTAELEGIEQSKIDRLTFEVMDTEKLVSEYNWLYDMVFNK